MQQLIFLQQVFGFQSALPLWRNSVNSVTNVENMVEDIPLDIKVAVMGCVVNGPGEAREADIGIAGGKGEAVLFVHGNPVKKLTGDNILDQFMEEIYKL